MIELFHNACYTFQKKVLEAGAGITEGQQEAILAEVMAMYAHDARVSIREFLADVLRRFLETAVQDLMLKPILATVAPVQEQIDAIPVPGLATLINLSDIAEECVERIVREVRFIKKYGINVVSAVAKALSPILTFHVSLGASVIDRFWVHGCS